MRRPRHSISSSFTPRKFFLEKCFCFCSEGMRKMSLTHLRSDSPQSEGSNTMSKITLTGFALLLLLFLGNSTGNYAAQPKQKNSNPPAGTFQRMIAENGSVTMDLDLNRLNGINSVGEDPPHCISPQLPIPFFLFWFSTISCAAPNQAQWHSSPKPNGSTASRGARRISQAARNRKTFARRAVRFGGARREDWIHVF